MRGQSMSPILNTSLFVRHHAGTIHKSNPEQILVFKTPHGTIHESNREHLLVFKAQRGDNRWVQSWTLPCLKGTTWGRCTSPIQNNSLLLRLHVGTIHEYNRDNQARTIPGSNPEHLLVFQAPRWDDSFVQMWTPSQMGGGGTDYVTSGPMGGLKINFTGMGQTHRHTDIANLWLTRPRGPSQWKSFKIKWTTKKNDIKRNIMESPVDCSSFSIYLHG